MAVFFIPTLMRQARSIHGNGLKATVAVLGAAANLAGIAGWTPEMVKAIEEEGKCRG